MLYSHGRTGHADDRMQNAEAATVGFKAGRGIGHGVESECAVTLGLNADINGESRCIRAFATCLIGDDETAVVLLNIQIMDFRIIGSPIAIPYQVGDGAQNLDAVIGDGAKIAVAEIDGKKPCFQMRCRGFCFARAIEQEWIDFAHFSNALMSMRLPLAALS